MFRLVQCSSLVPSLCLLAVGCAPPGESGVRSDKRLGQLSADERTLLCLYGNSLLKHSDGIKCEANTPVGKTTIHRLSLAQCEADLIKFIDLKKSACDSTVAEAERCVKEKALDPCGHKGTCVFISERLKACDVD